MTVVTFALIHGAGDVGWYWHRVERELRQRGHDTVAPDLPCEDNAAGLLDYADVVLDAIGDRREVAVVAQSFGGFTAPLVAAPRSGLSAGLGCRDDRGPGGGARGLAGQHRF